MSVLLPELVEQALSAVEPAERPLRRQLLGLLLASSRPSRLSYDEFLAWADEDTLAEWVEGGVIMTSPASSLHQDVADFLTSVLRIFVEAFGLGVVRSGPFQMKLATSGREPDLLFVATSHLDRLRPTYLDGPADLVIEIVSPESVGRDRGEKFYEYEAAGVSEYWLLDPQTRRAEFYRLAADGQYRLAPPDDQGMYHSAVVPGFRLHVSWLWQQPLPHVLDVLAELGVISPR